MKFTVYFANFFTGEVVAAQREAKSARHAENNFRRHLRDTGTLHKGDSYSLLVYTGWRELDIPAALIEAPRYTAR